MTSLLDGILAAFMAGLVNLIILSRLRHAYPPDEARFLRRVFGWALVLRYLGALVINAYAGESLRFADMFWGDSYTYDAGGYLIAQSWVGESFAAPSSQTTVSGIGYQYFVGVLYFLFGRNQLLAQFLNGTIGASAGLVIYAIARDLYTPGVARWAMLFMSFFPQMIFWSCAMYKDPSILLCIALCMYSVMNLRARFSPGLVVLFIGASLYLMTLRFYVFYMIAFATLGTFLFAQRRGFLGGLAAQFVLVGAFAAALTFGVRRETLEQQTAYFDFDRLQTARQGQIAQGRSAYGGESNVSTREGALAAIPVGLVYLLFAPFPWSISGTRQLLTLPETLLWYGLMPALVRGLIVTARTRLRAALPILVFASTLTLAYAVFQSNVGTAYRQRTQVTMFFFIFMGVGIEQRRQRRAQPILATRPGSASRPAWQR